MTELLEEEGMARIVELRWNCRECGLEGILGRHKNCPSCGSPRESGEMEMSGLSDDGSGKGLKTVTDESVLELANAGEDWFCAHCGSGNRGDRDTCVSCGAPRSEAPAPPKKAAKPPPPKKSKLKLFAAIAAVVCLIAAASVGAVMWGSAEYQVQGQVTSVTWNHTVNVEKWTPYVARIWSGDAVPREEIPPGGEEPAKGGLAFIGGCRSEVHHTVKVACGTYESCRDDCQRVVVGQNCRERCSDNGNGFATCRDVCTDVYERQCQEICSIKTKYCDDPVYKERCDYQSQRWEVIDVQKREGDALPATWAEVTPAPDLKITYASRYTAEISYEFKGRTRTLTEKLPSQVAGSTREKAERKLETFRQWQPGAKVTFILNNFGAVFDLKLVPAAEQSAAGTP